MKYIQIHRNGRYSLSPSETSLGVPVYGKPN